ncbi:MAG: MxaK protein [Gammaproteobacteria bacterium]
MRPAARLALWLLLVSGVALTGYSLVEWHRIQAGNELIRQLVAGKDVELGQVIGGDFELRLARAYYLKRRHRYDEALATLSLVMDRGDAGQRAETRYNLGNLYLEQALAQTEAMNIDTAMALAGLAKQAYRQSLALDSHDWDAKYNLEVAMRLLPEMDRITPEQEDEPADQKSQLWTTVPGFPRGLP